MGADIEIGRHTHSVNNSPGNTVLTLILGPCVVARHLTSWNCAALVTAYAIEEPFCDTPYPILSSAKPSQTKSMLIDEKGKGRGENAPLSSQW